MKDLNSKRFEDITALLLTQLSTEDDYTSVETTATSCDPVSYETVTYTINSGANTYYLTIGNVWEKEELRGLILKAIDEMRKKPDQHFEIDDDLKLKIKP